MTFNAALLREIRGMNEAGRPDLAELLGVSRDYLYRLESGLREPGVNFIQRLSRYSGIPIGAFFEEGGEDDRALPETPEKPGGIKNLTELIRSLNRERSVRKAMERTVSGLERLTEHLMAANELHARLAGVLFQDLPGQERTKEIAALAKSAARAGELRFSEIQGILRLNRSTLKHWLESEKALYSCKLSGERTVTASTPGEAGMLLLCFDCEARARDDCRGYGDSDYPENIFVLLALLEANGIYGRAEQARALRESYGIELSPHQISELLSRKKHGKPVPEDVENIYTRKRG
jgi:transcriptional regulator with XRE-family HTH domain